MAKGIGGPTWALLSPNNLPDESEWKTLLGAIVANYELPLQQYVPENVSAILPPNAQSKPTEDENFKVVLTKAANMTAWLRLGEILRATFNRDVENELHLTTTKVQTYTLKRQDTIFAGLKKQFGNEILEMVKKVPSRNQGAVFMVVALKVCVDAEISIQNSEERKASGKGAFPTNATLKANGIPPPTDLDVEGGLETGRKGTSDESQIAKGPRIFAIQYRVIKKKSSWLITSKPKSDAVDIGDNLVPKSNAMYGEQKDESKDTIEDEDEGWEGWGSDEEEGDDDDDIINDDRKGTKDDPIQLGKWEHTLALNQTEGSSVVMTTL